MPEWIGKHLIVEENDRKIIRDPTAILLIHYERKKRKLTEGKK